MELVIPGTAAASNATPAVLNVTCLCDVEENKTVTCPDNSTQHFWCNGMPGEHSLVCGSTTSGCATWDTTRGRYVMPDYCEKVAGDDGETTCLCDLELGAAADFSTADGATDAMAAFKSIMGAPIDLSKALMMIIILLSILVFHTGWSVVGGAQDRCDEKAEADAALVATSAFDVDADLPVGQGAAAALARRTEAIFTKQSWGHWWDVMCAEHPILNIVFVHDDTPRFVRIWAFAFEVLCGLWGMALEVMLSYPEPDPECASYTAQWEACDYCPEAIVGGVCYPEKIGQLGTVVQDQGDGTFAEVETTICPKAWKAARTACEDDGIKTRTIVGNKLCLWNRCAEECCDFYAGGCPDDPPDDSASPEHYMCLILVMIVFIPIVMIFEWAMDAYLTQPLPEALEPYLGGFCRGCAWICGQSAADDAADADGAGGAGDASNAAVQERLGAWSQGAGEGGAPPAPDAAAGGRRRRRRASDLELARRSFADPATRSSEHSPTTTPPPSECSGTWTRPRTPEPTPRTRRAARGGPAPVSARPPRPTAARRRPATTTRIGSPSWRPRTRRAATTRRPRRAPAAARRSTAPTTTPERSRTGRRSRADRSRRRRRAPTRRRRPSTSASRRGSERRRRQSRGRRGRTAGSRASSGRAARSGAPRPPAETARASSRAAST